MQAMAVVMWPDIRTPLQSSHGTETGGEDFGRDTADHGCMQYSTGKPKRIGSLCAACRLSMVCRSVTLKSVTHCDKHLQELESSPLTDEEAKLLVGVPTHTPPLPYIYKSSMVCTVRQALFTCISTGALNT